MINNQFENTNTECIFIGAREIAETLGISRAYAYRIIQKLNEELKAKGKLVLRGKTNRKYFYEKIDVSVGT